MHARKDVTKVALLMLTFAKAFTRTTILTGIGFKPYIDTNLDGPLPT
jgi:hypothetical protein